MPLSADARLVFSNLTRPEYADRAKAGDSFPETARDIIIEWLHCDTKLPKKRVKEVLAELVLAGHISEKFFGKPRPKGPENGDLFG